MKLGLGLRLGLRGMKLGLYLSFGQQCLPQENSVFLRKSFVKLQTDKLISPSVLQLHTKRGRGEMEREKIEGEGETETIGCRGEMEREKRKVEGEIEREKKER